MSVYSRALKRVNTLSIVKLISTYLLFARAHKENFFSWTWATLIGCLIAGKGFPSPIPTIQSVLVVLAITSSVYIYNDVHDIELDRLNPKKRERPLPTGQSTIEDAMRLVYITGLIGLLLSVFFMLVCMNITFFRIED